MNRSAAIARTLRTMTDGRADGPLRRLMEVPPSGAPRVVSSRYRVYEPESAAASNPSGRATKGVIVDEWQVLTVQQVARRVQLSSKTVMRAIRAGDLEASQLTQGRGGWRVRDDAVARWLEARSNRVSSSPLPDVRRVEPAVPRRPPSGSTAVQVNGRLIA